MTTTEPNWVPVDACTLPTIEQPLRLTEFNSLFELVTATDRVSRTQARLTLLGEPGLIERTQDLSDRESACCSFFTFTLTPFEPEAAESAVGVHLDIKVPDNRTDVLAALVDVAEAPRDGRSSS
jgi:hypothetical protein